jgi:hypothetical protein
MIQSLILIFESIAPSVLPFCHMMHNKSNAIRPPAQAVFRHNPYEHPGLPPTESSSRGCRRRPWRSKSVRPYRLTQWHKRMIIMTGNLLDCRVVGLRPTPRNDDDFFNTPQAVEHPGTGPSVCPATNGRLPNRISPSSQKLGGATRYKNWLRLASFWLRFGKRTQFGGTRLVGISSSATFSYGRSKKQNWVRFLKNRGPHDFRSGGPDICRGFQGREA